MKTKSNILLITFLFLVRHVAMATGITLSNQKEIQMASEIDHAIGDISQKVMQCLHVA